MVLRSVVKANGAGRSSWPPLLSLKTKGTDSPSVVSSESCDVISVLCFFSLPRFIPHDFIHLLCIRIYRVSQFVSIIIYTFSLYVISSMAGRDLTSLPIPVQVELYK